MSVKFHIVPPALVLWVGHVKFPKELENNLPSGKKRFYFIEGGRGSGKSLNVAEFLIERSRKETCRILCCREVQKSIKESVHALIQERIKNHQIEHEFEMKNNEIVHKITGSVFIFAGLRDHTTESIKSLQGVKYAWTEEAHTVSKKSLKILVPTIRLKDSQLVFTYNRYVENDPVHELMRREIKTAQEKRGMKYPSGMAEWLQAESKDAVHITMNHNANPFFPDVLRTEMEKEKNESFDSYLHIWEGKPVSQTADSIIKREDAEYAATREIHKPDGDIVVGVDVARFGDDLSVFYMRKGFKVLKYEEHRKCDTQTLATHLEDFVGRKKDTQIHVDDSGIGGAVTDALKSRGYTNVIPILFNQTPKDPDRYDMAISEMWFNFRDIIKDVQIPNLPELKEELCERKYSFDKKQRRSIEGKRDFKKRLGRSPDHADALLLCFYQSSSGGIVETDFSSSDLGYIYESRR